MRDCRTRKRDQLTRTWARAWRVSGRGARDFVENPLLVEDSVYHVDLLAATCPGTRPRGPFTLQIGTVGDPPEKLGAGGLVCKAPERRVHAQWPSAQQPFSGKKKGVTNQTATQRRPHRKVL